MRIGKPTSGRSPTREVLHPMRPTPTCIVGHKTTGDLRKAVTGSVTTNAKAKTLF